MSKKLKILLSAYACEPDKGSEPGIGWNIARELARHNHVWVLTRANNRSAIERKLSADPEPNLSFIYSDLPRRFSFWKRGQRGIHLYYYLWQAYSYRIARQQHQQIGFDLVQHATFGKYWSPSFLSLLPVPFVWGPVGGGDSAPKSFWGEFSRYGQIYEAMRESVRWLGEHDPFVRLAARRCRLALAATEETAQRLRQLGIRNVRVFSNVGLPADEFDYLQTIHTVAPAGTRFVSVGNLLHLKGFHLGLRAFASAAIENAEYWIIGDGPERSRLEMLAARLGIRDRVKFWGKLTRHETLQRLQQSHVMVHPSLHDSGGWACVEAMASKKPVICLDLGGPGLQIDEGAGIKAPAVQPEQAIAALAEAMTKLAGDERLRLAMGERARERAMREFSWQTKGERMTRIFHEFLTPVVA